MDNLGKKLSQYVITIVLVVFGLMFLVKYLSGDELESQPVAMLIGSIFLIIVGVLAAPDVMSKFPVGITRILGLVGVVLAIFLGWSVWTSVSSEIEFLDTKDRINSRVIQRLKDIREAQEAYAEFNGKYTSNFDTLIAWVKSPVVPITFRMGAFFLDSMPEEKYYELGYVLKRDEVDSVADELGMNREEFKELINRNKTAYKVVDTIFTSFYDENFAPDVRRTRKLPPVDLDSLPYSPYKGERWFIRTGSVEKGGLRRPTILVQDPTPFGRDKVKKDTLRFGSLDEPITDGNWK